MFNDQYSMIFNDLQCSSMIFNDLQNLSRIYPPKLAPIFPDISLVLHPSPVATLPRSTARLIEMRTKVAVDLSQLSRQGPSLGHVSGWPSHERSLPSTNTRIRRRSLKVEENSQPLVHLEWLFEIRRIILNLRYLRGWKDNAANPMINLPFSSIGMESYQPFVVRFEMCFSWLYGFTTI